jgi:UDP-N-acetylglucosamine transferase subunit ALG13
MIFLTVGTQLPFDRLVELLDGWAARNPDIKIFAQIGDAAYQPQHFEYCAFLNEQEYARAFDGADFILAHAGMGTILSSLMAAKPVVVFPRVAALGEHRNEHQLATCRKLEGLRGCYIAYENGELLSLLDNLQSLEGEQISPFASDELLDSLDRFISNDGLPLPTSP